MLDSDEIAITSNRRRPEWPPKRSAWWRFRHIVQSAGNAYSRLRSKSLIPAYA
ncbi:MAG: hypothetical protein QX196_06720 [Methylococcaceae bacterium]